MNRTEILDRLRLAKEAVESAGRDLENAFDLLTAIEKEVEEYAAAIDSVQQLKEMGKNRENPTMFDLLRVMHTSQPCSAAVFSEEMNIPLTKVNALLSHLSRRSWAVKDPTYQLWRITKDGQQAITALKKEHAPAATSPAILPFHGKANMYDMLRAIRGSLPRTTQDYARDLGVSVGTASTLLVHLRRKKWAYRDEESFWNLTTSGFDACDAYLKTADGVVT